MNTLTIWLLIVMAGGANTSVTVVERFTDRNECAMVSESIRAQSKEKANMPYLYGICVPVRADKLVKP